MAHGNVDSREYRLGQFYLLIVCGSFGMMCVCLFFFRREVLSHLLTAGWQPFILLSGCMLIAVSLVRGALLWTAAAQEQRPSRPSQCVMSFVPVVLYLLGIPQAPQSSASDFDRAEFANKVAGFAGLVAATPAQWNQLVAGAILGDRVPLRGPIDLQPLIRGTSYWHGKTLRVIGQYAAVAYGDNRHFYLTNLYDDLRLPVICTEPVTGIEPWQWIEVKGRIETKRIENINFPDRLHSIVLHVAKRKHIMPRTERWNPYIQ